jgi:NAD(P) transhydrogenase subunit beta
LGPGRRSKIRLAFYGHMSAGDLSASASLASAAAVKIKAEVRYDLVFEMKDINGEFGQTDVVLVLGANDVVNPAAKDPKSAIDGMPILEAYRAKSNIVNKRSMASDYAGLDNDLFHQPNTKMVFEDAEKVIESMVKAVD